MTAFTFLSFLPNLTAQNRPLGSWSIVNGKLSLSSRWDLWAEAQMRSTALYNDFFYYEVKGGLTYELNENIQMTVGTGSYQTYTIGGNFEQPKVQGETRTWLQLVMENQLGRVNFDHRYRAEQRFTTNGYRNRFRYRFNLVVPITHKEVQPSTLYTYLGDEIFLTNKKPYYERNRFFAGLGFVLSRRMAMQAGYLRQYDYRLESETSRDFFQLALLFNFQLQESDKTSVPKTTD